jgi:hypothetical protein
MYKNLALGHLDERLDQLLTKEIDAKARLTEISVNDLIGQSNRRPFVMTAPMVETLLVWFPSYYSILVRQATVNNGGTRRTI